MYDTYNIFKYIVFWTFTTTNLSRINQIPKSKCSCFLNDKKFSNFYRQTKDGVSFVNNLTNLNL